jgi:hypothetical protein
MREKFMTYYSSDLIKIFSLSKKNGEVSVVNYEQMKYLLSTMFCYNVLQIKNFLLVHFVAQHMSSHYSVSVHIHCKISGIMLLITV